MAEHSRQKIIHTQTNSRQFSPDFDFLNFDFENNNLSRIDKIKLLISKLRTFTPTFLTKQLIKRSHYVITHHYLFTDIDIRALLQLLKKEYEASCKREALDNVMLNIRVGINENFESRITPAIKEISHKSKLTQLNSSDENQGEKKAEIIRILNNCSPNTLNQSLNQKDSKSYKLKRIKLPVIPCIKATINTSLLMQNKNKCKLSPGISYRSKIDTLKRISHKLGKYTKNMIRHKLLHEYRKKGVTPSIDVETQMMNDRWTIYHNDDDENDIVQYTNKYSIQ